jgi:hypothetical protein
MSAPNAAQWCMREDERLPLRMALERNVRIARLECPRTASPSFAITSLVIDPIFQIQCMIISFAQSWLILIGLNLVTQHRLQSLHRFPQHLLQVLIFVLPFLFTPTIVNLDLDLDLDLVWRHARSNLSLHG